MTGEGSQIDNERLAFGATSSPCVHVTSSNKYWGGVCLKVFIPHMQVLYKQSSSSHSFNGFALEYNRSFHRALTPSFLFLFFLGF